MKNNYLNEMFNKSPIGILFYDESGKLVNANPAALKLAVALKLNISKEVNLFDDPNIIPKKEELTKKGYINFQINLNSKHKSNTSIYYSVTIADSGYLVQYINLEKSEMNLQKSKDKYRQWFEDDLTGDFIATPEGEIIECNPAFIEMYEFQTREEAFQSNISKFNPADWADLITLLKDEYKIQDYQSWHKKPNGKKIHVVANVVGIFNDYNELIQVRGYIFDDTERKKGEEALKESEEKYHRLFDEDLTGDFIATPEGEIIECNPAFAGIYGFYSCEQALKWNISQSNPFDWPYIITKLKNERKIQGFQSWQRRSDGMRIHVIANVVGIFNGDDELIQVKGYVFDDTERKRAEEELTHSKRQITEILDSIQDNFITLDKYWNFIYVNKCAAEYFGVESDDIIGQNLWQIFPELTKTTYENIFRKAMEDHKTRHFEAVSIYNIDKLYDFSVYPSSEGISVFWRDITLPKN
ncbi:PAS domain-containing protein [Methanobacterium sp. ACI-7]|uniref:PAS domain-containing protein n=1 Tax=unclassified Methanobacterium TaxID=2627676 RepID=UPI0039C3B304